MSVLFVAVPVALVFSLLAVVAYAQQVRSGQFDDLETPPIRILFDERDGTTNTTNAGDANTCASTGSSKKAESKIGIE